MTAFAAAMDRIFAHPDMATSAVWIAGGTSEERAIRLIRRAPDRITEFGSARILSETLTADIRVSDLPDPRPGDLIVIGAESFAAVDPGNTQKLARDLNKMGGRGETYRYVCFISPCFPGTKRQQNLERDGVQVWSVDIN